MQSRLEEEEQAKAALMGRIQRLTKLILVSTKNSIAANVPDKLEHRRRHSFGEDEVVSLNNFILIFLVYEFLPAAILSVCLFI